MVRLTLKDALSSNSIKMELSEGDPVNEIAETALEYWGNRKIVLVEGYRVLDGSKMVGESVSDGDTVIVIPDIGDILG